MHLHKSFHFFNSILFNSLSLLKIILKVSLGVYNLQCIRMLRINTEVIWTHFNLSVGSIKRQQNWQKHQAVKSPDQHQCNVHLELSSD